MSFEEVCRLCTIENKNLTQLFCANSKVVDKILFCTGIQIANEDGLPKQICQKCSHDLSISYEFKTMCIYTQNVLKNSANVKIEPYIEPQNDITISNYDIEDKWHSDEQKDIKIENEDNISQIKVKINNNHIKKENKLKRIFTNRLHTDETIERSESQSIVPCVKATKVPIKTTNKRPTKKLKQKTECTKKLRYPGGVMCEICGKSFRLKSSYDGHARSHRPPRYMCAHCTYKTCHKTDLIKHLRIHSLSDKKKYQCTLCPASFHNTSNLHGHTRRRHGGVKRFPCQLCERKFHTQGDLNRHVFLHNMPRPECEICYNTFAGRKHYKKHMFKIHNVVLPLEKPGRKKSNVII